MIELSFFDPFYTYMSASVMRKKTNACNKRPNPVGLPPCATLNDEYGPVITETRLSTTENVIGFAIM